MKNINKLLCALISFSLTMILVACGKSTSTYSSKSLNYFGDKFSWTMTEERIASWMVESFPLLEPSDISRHRKSSGDINYKAENCQGTPFSVTVSDKNGYISSITQGMGQDIGCVDIFKSWYGKPDIEGDNYYIWSGQMCGKNTSMRISTANIDQILLTIDLREDIPAPDGYVCFSDRQKVVSEAITEASNAYSSGNISSAFSTIESKVFEWVEFIPQESADVYNDIVVDHIVELIVKGKYETALGLCDKITDLRKKEMLDLAKGYNCYSKGEYDSAAMHLEKLDGKYDTKNALLYSKAKVAEYTDFAEAYEYYSQLPGSYEDVSALMDEYRDYFEMVSGEWVLMRDDAYDYDMEFKVVIFKNSEDDDKIYIGINCFGESGRVPAEDYLTSGDVVMIDVFTVFERFAYVISLNKVEISEYNMISYANGISGESRNGLLQQFIYERVN